jgi:hypothetical protein
MFKKYKGLWLHSICVMLMNETATGAQSVSATGCTTEEMKFRLILSSHSVSYEEFCHMGYNAMESI